MIKRLSEINLSCGAGIAIMIAAIILSLMIGCLRSLMPEYLKVQKVFKNGAYGDGFSITTDLSKLGESARNMAALAEQAIGETENIKAVKQARDALDNAKSVKDKHAAYMTLTYASEKLYSEAIDDERLSETQAKLIKQCYTDIQSRILTIKGDEYNEMAEDYNKKVSKFPARYIGLLVGVREAELFK
ncbi:MAG: LemA family protein [Clostridiales bacterium]|jgi:hypothetical protein|nr:LemA family protein [Clostridiales bacterium]